MLERARADGREEKKKEIGANIPWPEGTAARFIGCVGCQDDITAYRRTRSSWLVLFCCCGDRTVSIYDQSQFQHANPILEERRQFIPLETPDTVTVTNQLMNYSTVQLEWDDII